MSKLDRPFTENINFAVDPTNNQLYLDLGNGEVEAVVLVQHKTFSVMCTVEGSSTQLVPLACKLGTAPVFIVQLINDVREYVTGTALHQSDRDGSYRVHTRISNQLANW